MTFSSIEALRAGLGGDEAISPAYRAKQLHPVPAATQVNRRQFILDHCKGKRVLSFGASGRLHEEMLKVASVVYGIDREDGDGVVGFDLDDVAVAELPVVPAEIVVCGEVLEHLGNPLHFLKRLQKQYAGVPTIITVPNAFAPQPSLAKGIENVNKDHVAWYSPKTISVLLERAGYSVGDLFYYNGNGPTAEGLVVVTE